MRANWWIEVGILIRLEFFFVGFLVLIFESIIGYWGFFFFLLLFCC